MSVCAKHPPPNRGRAGWGGERLGSPFNDFAHGAATYAQRPRFIPHAPSPYPRPQGRGGVFA
jgi:hypothetical protein